MLILVRHAMPVVDPETPPADWVLSDEGRVAARQLAPILPAEPYLVASGEPKAWQTIEGAGQVTIDVRFGEVVRHGEGFGGDFRTPRRAYVDGADHPGWEPRATVTRRFDAAVGDHLVAAAGRPLVVASHGMAMTVWLTSRIGLDDPGAFWAELRFPDAVLVDLDAGRVSRPPW